MHSHSNQQTFIHQREPPTENKKDQTHTLRLPTRLHDSSSPTILIHRLDIITKAKSEASDGEDPEDDAQRLCHSQFELGRFILQVKADNNGDAHDGHVDAQSQVRKEGSLVGAVVARITVGVLEKQRAEEGRHAEDGFALMAVLFTRNCQSLHFLEGS